MVGHRCGWPWLWRCIVVVPLSPSVMYLPRPNSASPYYPPRPQFAFSKPHLPLLGKFRSLPPFLGIITEQVSSMNPTRKDEEKRLLQQERERLVAKLQHVDARLENYPDSELALMIGS